MAIDKVKLPDNSVEEVRDSRIPGIDSAPTANSSNLVTSGGVKGALDGYLPLTGGTMTGSINSLSNHLLQFNGNTIVETYSGDTYLRGTSHIYLDTPGLYTINGSTVNAIWHQGNDGAGSGLDADLLDGWHGERYVSYNGDTLGNDVDFNAITYKRGSSIVIQPIHVPNYSGQTNYPYNGYGQMLTFGGQESLFPFRIAHINNSRLYYQRAGYKESQTFDFSGGSAWEQIAFTSSNVASATKLETPRSIWGQSFDGTGNVSGAMTGVNSDNTTGIGTAITIGCPDVPGLSAAGNGVGITMGLSGEQYYTRIATVFEGNNPSYLQPALAFYTMYNSYQAGSEVERMRISANGDVGIGTTSPTEKLHVNGNILVDKPTSGGVLIGRDGNTIEGYYNGSLTDLYLNYASSHNVNLCYGGGNVGVGRTASSYKLDVNGDTRSISSTTTLQTSQPSDGMLPNRQYALGELSGDTTFSMAYGSSNVTNHYYWTFSTGSTAPTITWPAAITSWYGGSAPTINASKLYEVSVLDGVAICMEV